MEEEDGVSSEDTDSGEEEGSLSSEEDSEDGSDDCSLEAGEEASAEEDEERELLLGLLGEQPTRSNIPITAVIRVFVFISFSPSLWQRRRFALCLE